jgi:hypothetical protein
MLDNEAFIKQKLNLNGRTSVLVQGDVAAQWLPVEFVFLICFEVNVPVLKAKEAMSLKDFFPPNIVDLAMNLVHFVR